MLHERSYQNNKLSHGQFAKYPADPAVLDPSSITLQTHTAVDSDSARLTLMLSCKNDLLAGSGAECTHIKVSYKHILVLSGKLQQALL